MAREATLKQKRFAKKYVETGNGSESAKAVYDVSTDESARAVASQNLTKLPVQKEIAKRLMPELVNDAHLSLLTAVRLDYFVFPKLMTDEEITKHIEAQGLTCLNVRPTEKGKMAFFSLPDGASRGKGIELFHKVNGTFAPDKSVNINIEAEASDVIKGLAQQLNELQRRTSITGNGTLPGPVGDQAQDQE